MARWWWVYSTRCRDDVRFQIFSATYLRKTQPELNTCLDQNYAGVTRRTRVTAVRIT